MRRGQPLPGMLWHLFAWTKQDFVGYRISVASPLFNPLQERNSTMAIDFTLSPEQRQLQANARAFAEGVLAPVAAQLDAIADAAEAFYSTRAAYREMAKAGFTKSFIPVADGGLGFGLVEFALAAEELARVEINVPTTLLASGLGLQPVIQFGDASQRTLFLQPFVDDQDGSLLASFAFTAVAGRANF